MAENDIRVSKENASGTFDEVVLTPAQIGAQAAGSYATLVNGLVPSNQLPSFVDDVLEYANLAAFPATGESGKIFVAIDTRKTFRWSGSAYVEISPSEVTSVAGRTGAVTLSNTDISGLGSAATADKPASGNASSNQVVLGSDTRLPNQSLNTTSSPTFANLRVSSLGPTAGLVAADDDGNLARADDLSANGILEFIGAAAASHNHSASDITSGTLDIARIPTGTTSTQVALGNHTHTPSEVGLGNVSNAAQVTSVSGTAPIVSSGGTTPAISISDATTSASGAMSASDKTKLDGIAANATANSSDATLLARANHTGTQAANTITGLAAIATSGSASDLGSGTVPIARIPTGTTSTTVALGNHSHELTALAATGATNGHVLTANGSGGVTFAAASSFNAASPGAIGGTTPSTGAFTTLTATPAANTAAFTTTGYSLTGSNAQSLVDLAGTWNTTGTPSAIKLNITDTASNASSLLMQLQTGGTNRFTVSKGGALVCGSTVTSSGFAVSTGDFISNGFPVLRSGTTEMLCFTTNSSVNVAANGAYSIGWASGAPTGTGIDLRMWRDAAATWALRDGTNAMEARVYGTFASSTNYQRMTIKSVKQTLSALSGSSATTTGTFIPDGAVVVGVTTRVATAITGATGYQVGDGTTATRWGDITGTAIGTTSDNRDWTAGTIECFTAGGNITLTAKTSNFTAGAIEVCVFYLAGEAD